MIAVVYKEKIFLFGDTTINREILHNNGIHRVLEQMIEDEDYYGPDHLIVSTRTIVISEKKE